MNDAIVENKKESILTRDLFGGKKKDSPPGIFKRIATIMSSAILVVLLLIIVLLIIYVVNVKTMQKEGKLNKIPYNFYVILTQSMYPKIKAGDLVITVKDKNDDYMKGDIITFVSNDGRSEGIIITHRIVEKMKVNDNLYYKTKGDANNTADRTNVASSDVIGRVVVKIPKAGYIQQFLSTKFGWIVAIVIPCVGVIIHDVIKFIRVLLGKKA